MAKVISFCACCSGTGKTTLVLRILEELRRRGVRTAVIKHGSHRDIDESKDSCRYAAAGAEASLFVSPHGWMLESRPEGELSTEMAISLLLGCTSCEVLLIEGYKKAAVEKIAVCRQAVSLKLPCPEEELLAVVSDVPLDTGLRQFSYDQKGVVELCDFILSRPEISKAEYTLFPDENIAQG
jgi:molybdopterin-guanine dinucleotide biosynthesis protein B